MTLAMHSSVCSNSKTKSARNTPKSGEGEGGPRVLEDDTENLRFPLTPPLLNSLVRGQLAEKGVPSSRELSHSLPASATACSRLDSLSFCFLGLLALGSHPPSSRTGIE